MKKYINKIFVLNLCFLFSCSNPGTVTNTNNYKSFLNSDKYTSIRTEIINNKNDSPSLSIDQLTPYYKNNTSKNIKSDFTFHTESNSDIKIDKVILSESQQQIDQNGSYSIVPDYSGKKINITIIGKFELEDFSPEEFFFINEPNLIHLSYAGENKPKTKVLIDDGILLNPISASKSYINLTIDSKDIIDFYLKGMHKLSIISDKKVTSTMIRIGEPVAPKVSLNPQVDKIEILKSGNKAMALKLTGKNFMLYPKFYYTLIDGKFYPGYQSDIISTSTGDIWETVISIAEHKDFFNKTNHTLEFYTPFGLSYSNFSN